MMANTTNSASVTKANKVRQLLRAGEWIAYPLALEVGADSSYVWRLIDREIKKGNVEMTGYDQTGRYRTYTWVGDDDIFTTAIRAAEYLRKHTKDQLGLAIADKLMQKAGATL